MKNNKKIKKKWPVKVPAPKEDSSKTLASNTRGHYWEHVQSKVRLLERRNLYLGSSTLGSCSLSDISVKWPPCYLLKSHGVADDNG